MSTPTGLQRYQMMEALGAGTQGKTFRAIDRVTNTAVAIKVLELRDLGGDWKPFDLFERECQVLRDLKHPAIPRYLDQFTSETGREFFLVMELVEGEPLSRRFGRAGTPSSELLALLDQALGILEYLHARHPPVIHRDIKPSNLIARPQRADSPLALIDFGGVRVALAQDGGSTMIGTFGYMAPEQLHGEVTPATDIYALGATIAALAAGTPADRLPRRGLTIDLSGVLPEGPLRTVLTQMLAPEPAQRLPDAAAVRRALAAAHLSSRTGASAQAATPQATPGELTARPAATIARNDPPRFLGWIVWLWSLMAAGLFWFIELAILPVFFAIVGQRRRYAKPNRRRRLAERQVRAIAAVRGIRGRIEAISTRFDPSRRALPPADDDR